MKTTKIYNYWLLESDSYLTENKEEPIEKRLFFKTIRVKEENISSIREATEEEIAEWEEYKRKQEEELAMNVA